MAKKIGLKTKTPMPCADPRERSHAFTEVALVEREPKFSVFEHEIISRAVVAAAVHGASGSYLGFLLPRRG